MTTFQQRISDSSNDGYVWEGDAGLYATDTEIFVSDGSGDNDWGGWRFTNVTIPVGATITNAYLTFRSTGITGAPANMRLYGVAEDNCAAWASGHKPWNGASGVTPTTAYVAYNPAAWVSGTSYNTPNIATIIQEIINRAGWASGNALGVLWWPNADKAGSNWYKIVDRTHATLGASYAAQLTVEYTEATGHPMILRGQEVPGLRRIRPGRIGF